MFYLKPETIEEMHVEITNKCNAACPMCDRNIFGSVDNPGKGLSEWNLNDISRVFNEELTNLKNVYFCGSHGDPIAAKYLFEAIEAVKERGAAIEMFTNGSLKTESWWQRLVDILDERDRISFGVDGLETNHLYRQRTNIEKIVSHMKIACKGKVRVRWDFLAFKHNEYELENCKKFAKEIGVTDFRIRRTPRFDRYQPFPVLNEKKEITHYLEPPESPELRHPSHDKIKTLKKQVDMTDPKNVFKVVSDMEKNNKNNIIEKDSIVDNEWKISCMYQEAKKIYVNSRLDVFPCSYLSDSNETFKKVTKTELKYPEGELSLKNKSWQQILSHEYYATELVKSFENSNVIPRCIRTCGVVRRTYEQNMQVEI